MLLYVLDTTARAQALAFNDQNASDHLPLGYAVNPIAVGAPAPYAYAGKWVLPTGLASNVNYAVMWNFLATLPTANIDPSEAWPFVDE